ncbi:hypothetical protein BHS09_04320 [Myxococcus xanthus]|uniref:Uncharacterized protein n=1 Tax=Myxococcus xanthus TaxID=34 RepID=A0AAE6FWM7_MYXXA|nr:hypothetical protein [Myxococcus xanthus]QDE66284.1 hypothetical protein BHS09_04320 [Myxococcus xanthus]QDE73557.1 hypothetical protein BHS08_04325 [Myxococcus xanthus]
MHPPLENGARRGAQVRCPACTRFNAPGLLCPRCDCGPVPPERYGAARMLVHAGVDRYALADRVLLLPTSMAEQLESRYARMWAHVRRLLVDVRRSEQALFLQGFEEEVEDRWVQRLPWHVPEEEPAAELEEGLHTAVPAQEPRWLAALVDVHEGTPSHAALDTVLTCLEDDGRFGCEAALALTRWRVWPHARRARVAAERIARLARAVFARFPEQGARAAVAWMRATGQAPDVDLLLALREGLRHPDADVRFECALCLQDEDGLLAAVESTDLARAAEARRALASRGSVRLLERMASRGDADFALDVLRRLPAQAPPEALSALLAVSDRVEGGLAEALHGWARGRPFAELSPEERALWADWALARLARLSAEDALRFLEWAAAAPGADGVEETRAFVSAVSESLAREPPSLRATRFRDAAFSRFLTLTDEEDALRLHLWSREAPCTEPLLEAVLSLPSRLPWGDALAPGQGARLLMALWKGEGRERLLAPLAKVVRAWSGSSQQAVFIEAVWRRFQQHPDERTDLLATFMPWRAALWERQQAAEPDAVVCFQTWWPVEDPEQLPERVDALVRQSPPEDLSRRLEPVWKAAEVRGAAWPRATSLAVSYAAAVLSEAVRQDVDALDPEAEGFLSWFPGFRERVAAVSPTSSERSYSRDFLEDIEAHVRRIREHLERKRQREDQAREAELRRMVEASRQRDLERQRELMARQVEASPPAHDVEVAPLRTPLVLLNPRGPVQPLDLEVCFPEARLRTLLDYTRLLKVISANNDVMAVFEVHGLSVAAWTSEATAWGALLVRRPELASRFGALFQGPWG